MASHPEGPGSNPQGTDLLQWYPDPCLRYQLQEEILAKEQALEELKSKNNQIQNEMKLLAWENKQLQDKLFDRSKQQLSKEENVINRLEMQMKSMQKELQCVQLARKQAEERCRLQEAASSMSNRGSKGQTSQVMVLEQQLRDAKDELEELNMKQSECAYQEEYYRGKYLLAQQQVEEQRGQIEIMEADNRRITNQVEEEIQRVKCQFQEKLEELKSLPDALKTTQCRLQEAIQRQKAAEETCYEYELEAEDARAKMMEATQKLDQFWNQQQDSINQQDSLAAKAEAWEKKCQELTDCSCKLKGEMEKLEECAAQCRRCAEEKSVEILQLNNQLECAREDSARQVAKAKERCETIRRSYQCQIEDLERQLAQTRASAHAAQAERDEYQFQEKLEELKSLPDALKTTQCRLQEAIQRQKAAEETCYEYELEAEDARAKMMEATQKLDQFWNQQQDSINQQDSLAAKAEAWEKKCQELTDCSCKLKGEMEKLEECAAQCRRCAEEKSVEILQLNNQLECAREDSARQVAKAKERCGILYGIIAALRQAAMAM
ncbi:outer dense fiber protein 2-like [Hetaerina americana]|uniref:outer dense fiber protein 2-like n=1 Tax=Hetaerina americana TaxID=62018 RepID=UPI003A7F37F3